MNDPKPARSAPRPIVLEGRYTRLEPIGLHHAASLFAATGGAGIEERYRWLSVPPKQTEAAMRDWIAASMVSADPLTFAVIDRASGLCGGRQSFMRIEPAHGVIEIGGVLWGRGVARTRIATEALYLFACHAFDELGYRRFEWKCNERNEPSKRAALRFGFTYEGTFRQHMIVKGENRDTAWFAILDGEWPDRKARLEAWLAPENFDAEGYQVKELGEA